MFDKIGIFLITIPCIESVRESGYHLKIADLRGSLTIEMGVEYVGMELSEFYKLMEIPETVPPDTQMHNVSYFVPGWEFHVIRDSR